MVQRNIQIVANKFQHI